MREEAGAGEPIDRLRSLCEGANPTNADLVLERAFTLESVAPDKDEPFDEVGILRGEPNREAPTEGVPQKDTLGDLVLIEELLYPFTVLKGSPASAVVRGGKGKWGATEAGEVNEHDPAVLRQQLAELAYRFK